MPGVLMTEVMKNRGYDTEYMRAIETGSAHRMRGMDEMTEKLRGLQVAGAHIIILPDFDMDGIASGTLGFAGLSEMGFRVSLYIPNSKESYGFREADIDKILEQYPDAKAILTCDVGSGCYGAISYAKNEGLDVLVTDHHSVAVVPADAAVVVNPMQSGDEYEHKGICGAFVFWQVINDYAQKYGTIHQKEAIERLRVFAGIGTVSDSMPMLYENRQLVRDAVAICRSVYSEGDFEYVRAMGTGEVYTLAFQGLFYVLKAYQELGKISCPDDINENFFGYYMAPMFNALKRMAVSVEEAFLVFFGDNQEERVANLMALNEQRKVLVEQYLMQIHEAPNVHAPYIYVTDAPGGFAGLLAMRLFQDSGEPTVVVRKTEKGYEGSARSPEWYPFLTAIRDMHHDGVSAAGHEGACGVVIDNDEAMFDLFMYLSGTTAAKRPTETTPAYDAVIGIDGCAPFEVDVMASYVHDKHWFRPFGAQFEQPVILARISTDFALFDHIGSEGQHLRILLPGGIKVLCWNQAGEEERYLKKGVLEVLGDINANVFRSVTSYQMEGQLV